MTVYLVQQPRSRNAVNLEPAKEFGTIVPLLSEDVNATYNSSMVVGEMDRALGDFNPDQDYILAAQGDPLSILYIGAILQRRGVANFTWLRYSKRKDTRTGAYSGDFYYAKCRISLLPAIR